MAQLLTEVPGVLYKFRRPADRDVECLLARREIYLASPLKLNDPFDCYPVVTVPPVAERRRLVEEAMAHAPPGLEEEARRRSELLFTSPLHRARYPDEFFREDFGRMGVVSLSASRDNPLLWAHYAESASGFAVGYRARDEDGLEAFPALPIDYTMDRPQMPCMGEADWPRILFTKSEHWAHEQEWRYVRLADDGGVGPMVVSAGSIVEVCLGPRMKKEHRAAVVTAARSLPDRPRILLARLMPERFGLTFERVD